MKRQDRYLLMILATLGGMFPMWQNMSSNETPKVLAVSTTSEVFKQTPQIEIALKDLQENRAPASLTSVNSGAVRIRYKTAWTSPVVTNRKLHSSK